MEREGRERERGERERGSAARSTQLPLQLDWLRRLQLGLYFVASFVRMSRCRSRVVNSVAA